MCTIGRTPAGTAGKAHHRTDPAECTVRGGQERTDCGSKRGRNSFLSTAFIPLAQNNLTVDCYDSGECNSINVITRDNYEFLRDSYFRYSLLLQKEGVHTPGNSVGEGIANLYDEMNTLVGDELHVNIEQEAGRLFFRLWKYHKWGSFTLYYFPVKFLESLNPVLRRIAITFIHKLMKANGIDTFVDYEESDFLFEMLSEDDGSDPEEWKERMKLLNSYQEGKISRLLKRVESKSYYKNLPKALDTYEPRNGFEQPLVDAMKRALAVYRKIFTGKASSKLLNGVPLARWTYNRLKQETDKEKLLKIITQKFSVLTPQYVAVLQEARGVKGDRTRTTEIVLGELFDNILKD